ncbi:hypothetical protein Gpo141_00013723, partial [Globisporangium polare]
MARRVLVGAVASLMLASVSGTCTTPPTFSGQKQSLATITSATKVVIPSTSFINSGQTAAFGGCTGAQRVEITSVRLKELADVTITAKVVYLKPSATTSYDVKDLNAAATSCYEDTVPAHFSFATFADANPEKTDAAIEVTCPSGATTACNVDYEITATCVTKSAMCTPMPGTAVPLASFAANAKTTIPLTDYKATAGASTVAPTCDPLTQRLDITSVKVTETNGNNIQVNVGYQNAAAVQTQVAGVASGTCYQSTAATDVQFGAKATANADKTTPYVDVTCKLTTGTCALSYEVVAQCVTKTPYPVLPNTITVPMTVGAAGGSIPVPLTAVVDRKGAVLASCATGTRLDILSAAFVETSAATITADVKYQSATAKSITVKSFNTATTSAFLSTITAAEL